MTSSAIDWSRSARATLDRKPDLTFKGLLTFSATSVEIVSGTPAGRAFCEKFFGGVGVVGGTVRKSIACALLDRATKDGLSVTPEE